MSTKPPSESPKLAGRLSLDAVDNEVSEAPRSLSLKGFVAELESAMCTDGVGWCSLDKATTLASIIWALRPTVVVELGVWMGGSAIPMAIALRDLGAGQLIAVDAWKSCHESVGQGTGTALRCFDRAGYSQAVGTKAARPR